MFNLAVCKSISSTQIYLCDALKHGLKYDDFALLSLSQISGIGSNNRTWESEKNDIGNLFYVFSNDELKDLELVFFDNYKNFNLDFQRNIYLSFYTNKIPYDLPIQSASIYFATLLKLVLKDFGSEIFIKWPNDIYLKNKKIGGILTTKIKDKLVCGLGLNTVTFPENAEKLDIKISTQILLKAFFDKITEKISWKEVFEYYKNDFEMSKAFYFKNDDKVYSLADAKLYSDGSILIDNKRIYSLR